MIGIVFTILIAVIFAASNIYCSVLTDLLTNRFNNSKPAGSEYKMVEGKPMYKPTKEFPYSAALELNNKFRCTAVIIRQDIVLTATHCVEGVAGNKLKVRAGTFNKLDKFGEFMQLRDVEIKFKRKRRQVHDITNLKLKIPFVFTDYVKAIKLAEKRQENEFVSQEVLAIGFGKLSENQKTNTLMQVVVEVLPKPHCKDMFRGFTPNMLCTGTLDVLTGLGKGDSGGPLIASHTLDNPENDILIGIASGRNPKYDEESLILFPIYMDVAVFRDSIDKTIREIKKT